MRITITICLVAFTLLLCPFSNSQAQSRLELAKTEIAAQNSLLEESDLEDLIQKDHHVSRISGIAHTYFRQRHNGLEIFGAIASIHTDYAGKVIKVNNAFVPAIKSKTSVATPSISPIQAIKSVASKLGYRTTGNLQQLSQSKNTQMETLISGGDVSELDIPVRLMYIEKNNELKLAWEMSVKEKTTVDWWQLLVDAQSGEILEKMNWTVSCGWSDAHDHSHHNQPKKEKRPNAIDLGGILLDEPDESNTSEFLGGYRVYARPLRNPYFGNRTLENNPHDATASPFGWHDTDGSPGAELTITSGNNVHAYDSGDHIGYSPDGGSGLVFDFPIDTTYSSTNQSEDASITNLFYWNNIMHDILYQYGFDEASGNFQKNNYGNGGSPGDEVQARAQITDDCAGYFTTPIDGISPNMRMYYCGTHDGSLDNVVIAHEYAHGISERLTGGASTNACIVTGDEEQMSEGWSDWYSLLVTMDASSSATTSRSIGNYLFTLGPNGNGVRTFPYNTLMSVNPHTYDDIKTLGVRHGVGSVWCTMLWEMTWELIDEYGYDPDIYSGNGGNNIALELVTEGLKLQVCRPGFVEARDAILTADQALNGGANQCLIWKAFAKRGLGVSALQGSSSDKSDGTEAFDLPASCPIIPATCTQEYTTLPYSTGFESGDLDQFWCTSSETSSGRIIVTSGFAPPHSGSNHLTMDNDSQSGNFNTNEATLGLKLEGMTNADLEFWWKEFGDENHVEDGIFFSDDGGANYTLVHSLNDGSANWTKVILDIDSLAALHGLSMTDTFVVKFQQRDNFPISADGFAFDDISVTECIQEYADIPYSTGFESGGLDQFWCTSSETSSGRILVTSGFAPPHSGSNHLTMDNDSQSGNFNTNEATLGLKLEGMTNADLEFWWKEFGDENHVEDGIFFSDDGGANYTLVHSLNDGSANWTKVILDIDSLTALHGLSMTNTFVVKFQQRDNFPISFDGFAFDDISVTECIQEYADLPYSTGFESGGLDQFWCTSSETSSGRIMVTNSFVPHSGSNHLTMDNDSQSGEFNRNEAVLGLKLEGVSRPYLEFWWKEFGDENHVEDGIFFSDDGGANYTLVHSLHNGSVNWTKVILDIDSLTALHGLSMTNTFVVKFQQRDNFYIPVDGFAFDDISVTECRQEYADIPYLTGFESGGLDQFWCTSSETSSGRIMVTNSFVPHSGSNHLTMDNDSPSGKFNRNEAVLGLKLEGVFRPYLEFWWKEFGDENHVEDGIFFSDDGGANYTLVHSLHNGSANWTKVILDIDALTALHGLSMTNTFVVKFQQRDNSSISVDGFAFDDIIVGPSAISFNNSSSNRTDQASNGFRGNDIMDSEKKYIIALSNYPNPFNTTTTIEYSLSEESIVDLIITDITGKVIARPVSQIEQSGGVHTVLFESGKLADGIYFYTLVANNQRITKEMVVAH